MRLPKRSVFLGVLALLMLSGCSATGPKFAELESTSVSPPPGQGRIYIYRKPGLVGAAVQPKVYLNGEQVGVAKPGGFTFADRAPGNYDVQVSTEVKRTASFTLEAGETRYVRLEISMGFFVGHVYPTLVDGKEGADEIQACSYATE